MNRSLLCKMKEKNERLNKEKGKKRVTKREIRKIKNKKRDDKKGGTQGNSGRDRKE